MPTLAQSLTSTLVRAELLRFVDTLQRVAQDVQMVDRDRQTVREIGALLLSVSLTIPITSEVEIVNT